VEDYCTYISATVTPSTQTIVVSFRFRFIVAVEAMYATSLRPATSFFWGAWTSLCFNLQPMNPSMSSSHLIFLVVLVCKLPYQDRRDGYPIRELQNARNVQLCGHLEWQGMLPFTRSWPQEQERQRQQRPRRCQWRQQSHQHRHQVQQHPRQSRQHPGQHHQHRR
jgi:hypothetical protein